MAPSHFKRVIGLHQTPRIAQFETYTLTIAPEVVSAHTNPVKVLITGMAGFIGFHLARRMVEIGHRVFGIDNLNHYYNVRLKLDRLQELGITCTDNQGPKTITADSGLRFRRLDVTDAEAVVALCAEEQFDVVCHLAAQAGVRYSLSDPFAYTANNVHGFLSVLEAVRQNPVRHLVYASSSSVYGLDRHVPFSESGAADHPVSLYAATKRANELMAHSYSHLFGIPSTGLRFFTVYGPWGRPDMALFSFTRAILNGEPIDLYNHGNMERDFTYVDDVVEAVLLVIDHPPDSAADWDVRPSAVSSARARVYNVGNGDPVSVLDLVNALEQALGKKAIVREVPIQPGDVPRTWADRTALREELGHTAHTSITDGAQGFATWFHRYHAIACDPKLNG